MIGLPADSKELLIHHRALGVYAKRVIPHEQVLPPLEEGDWARRMAEFRAIASSMRLTEKEMASLLIKGLLAEERECGCPACRERNARSVL